MSRRKLPYLPLYIQDFMTDEKLIECSAQSTGVYIRLMCILHKQDEYGKLLLRQKHKQTEQQILNFATQLATSLPYTVGVISSALDELLSEKVIHIDGDYLYQKRMVRDAEISDKRAKSGSAGGKKTKKKFAKAKLAAKQAANTDIESDIEFESIWNLYDKKKGDKQKLTLRWQKLSKDERSKIFAHVPVYVKSTPDKKYRKDFETYLNKKAWNDEVIGGNSGENKIHLMNPFGEKVYMTETQFNNHPHKSSYKIL